MDLEDLLRHATSPHRWLGFVLLAAACGTGEASRSQESAGASGVSTIPVAAQAVARRDLSRSVVVAGAVEPVRTVGVNAQTSGTVLTIAVQEGDRVKAGQLLAELDGRETAAQLARARAVLESAAAAFTRDSALHVGTIITDAEFERSRAAFEVAKSDVALWQARRAFTRIVAPSAGVVTAKLVEAGSAVSPNQRVIDLADVSLLVVRVRLSEMDVVHVAPGAAVAVRLDAYPAVSLAGQVRRVFPSADPQSRLVPVEVALGPRPAGVFVRPGFLARVEFALERRADVLAVPAAAVGVATAGTFVYVVEADTLAVRPVVVGVTAEGWVEALGGLREGDQVVVSGHANLRSGARVVVRTAPLETVPPGT